MQPTDHTAQEDRNQPAGGFNIIADNSFNFGNITNR